MLSIFQRRLQHLQRVRPRLHVVHERAHDLRAAAHRRGIGGPRQGVRHPRQVQTQGKELNSDLCLFVSRAALAAQHYVNSGAASNPAFW